MGDMLTQAEIDALLNGTSAGGEDNMVQNANALTTENIENLKSLETTGMEASASAMTTLLGHEVKINIKEISVGTWDELLKEEDDKRIAASMEFKDKKDVKTLLVLKSKTVKKITGSMTDAEDTDSELNELDYGVLGEIINQSAGSFVTALSSIINRKINISPPEVKEIDLNDSSYPGFDDSQGIVNIKLDLSVEDICNDTMFHLMPVSFAKGLTEDNEAGKNDDRRKEVVEEKIESTGSQSTNPERNNSDMKQQPSNGFVNVQPAKFQKFDDDIKEIIESNNLNLIMDVPLQITVELGRTHKLIRNILEYGPGSVIELDKLAGEPVDILVNGRNIAKGEVVVIDESFGVRITDIVDPSKRL